MVLHEDAARMAKHKQQLQIPNDPALVVSPKSYFVMHPDAASDAADLSTGARYPGEALRKVSKLRNDPRVRSILGSKPRPMSAKPASTPSRNHKRPMSAKPASKSFQRRASCLERSNTTTSPSTKMNRRRATTRNAKSPEEVLKKVANSEGEGRSDPEMDEGAREESRKLDQELITAKEENKRLQVLTPHCWEV